MPQGGIWTSRNLENDGSRSSSKTVTANSSYQWCFVNIEKPQKGEWIYWKISWKNALNQDIECGHFKQNGIYG
jgi:hypothetical protein